jgi:hypothetical protein
MARRQWWWHLALVDEIAEGIGRCRMIGGTAPLLPVRLARGGLEAIVFDQAHGTDPACGHTRDDGKDHVEKTAHCSVRYTVHGGASNARLRS